MTLAALVSGTAASNRTAECGEKGRSLGTQIVNGDDASLCEYKWQVGFQSADSITATPWCGGSLVSEEWVLSAAHCAEKANFYVVAGQWNVKKVSGKEQVRKASRVYRHPSYNENTMTHDFVMVKVDTPFVFDDCVGSVCLPTGAVGDKVECQISGWGTLSSGGAQPFILQEAIVATISKAKCVNDFDYTYTDIDDSMLCAQGKKGVNIVDACQGDSGGPLVCESGGKFSIHGATSWGYGCAGPTYPGIWARVSTVTSWIESVMDGTYVPPPPPACRRRWCR